MNQEGKNIVFILEDEPAHAEAIRRYLSADKKYEILVAGSLKELNDTLSKSFPDLLLADINLPDGSSFSLLKGSLEDQSWPVVIMTSFGDEELAVKAIKSGAIDYIVKSPEAFRNISYVVERNLREWSHIRKRIETEKDFRILFETMAQGVIYHNSEGAIIAANSAAEKITGYTLKQMQNRSASDPRSRMAIHEDGSVFEPEAFPVTITLKTGKPVKDVVMGLLNPEKDRYTWVLINSTPQFRENGEKPYQVFTSFTDITDLKQQELELKKAKERAEESDRLKSAFMANMSHEIRTPMNGIIGFADLLRTPNLSGESQKLYIEAINTSGRRMLNIINDLIDISRIESGQLELRKSKTNMPGLLNEIMIFFQPEAEKKGVWLKDNIQLPSADFTIETDKTKVSQVLTNLIKNALKFTNKGGMIELGCVIEKDTLLLYVSDTGVGIRKELQERIFERFRQGDNREKHEGLGLGLAISRAFVELLGGQIWVLSEPGQGSVFSFTIPLEKQYHMAVPETDISSDMASTCLNVLIAEDDDMNFLLLSEALKRSHVQIYHAENGLEAVNLVKNRNDISIVLMDIKLPVMSGIDAVKEIKKIRPELPVIAQSAYANESEIKRSFDAGCDDYITKPIDLRLLLNKLNWYCKSSSNVHP